MHQRPLKTSTTLPWPLLRKVWFNTLVLDLASFAPEPLAARAASAHDTAASAHDTAASAHDTAASAHARPAAIEPGPASSVRSARASASQPFSGWGLLS